MEELRSRIQLMQQQLAPLPGLHTRFQMLRHKAKVYSRLKCRHVARCSLTGYTEDVKGSNLHGCIKLSFCWQYVTCDLGAGQI
eukprot:1153558-Pelagomonas_calceolata.AAC.3